MKAKCLVIDDEPHARDLIKFYISEIDTLILLDEFDNALSSYQFLQQHKVDLLFLDIQMPGFTGLDLIKSLHYKPAVILTTAYREYGVEGFELDVVDYLLKPVSFERFLKSVSKYQHLDTVQHLKSEIRQPDPSQHVYMYFKVNREMVKIYLRDILYIESIKDYIKVFTADKSYITYQRLGHLEDTLPEEKFVRCHKSYIVSLEKIERFKNDHVNISGQQLPIGRAYRKRFMESLGYHNDYLKYDS